MCKNQNLEMELFFCCTKIPCIQNQILVFRIGIIALIELHMQHMRLRSPYFRIVYCVFLSLGRTNLCISGLGPSIS